MFAIQKLCETLGKNGCYFFCLIHTADKMASKEGLKKLVDIPQILEFAHTCIIEKLMGSDCFVQKPAEIMNKWLWWHFENTTKKISITKAYDIPGAKKELFKYQKQAGEFPIYRFYNPCTKLSHFACNGYDPLGESITAKEGFKFGVRVFKWDEEQEKQND